MEQIIAYVTITRFMVVVVLLVVALLIDFLLDAYIMLFKRTSPETIANIVDQKVEQVIKPKGTVVQSPTPEQERIDNEKEAIDKYYANREEVTQDLRT